MLIVTFITILAFIITLGGRLLGNSRDSFFIAIVLLICFFGLRTDYGNDTHWYMDGFEYYRNFEFTNLFEGKFQRWEPGWIVLNRIFGPLGWQPFIFFLTIIQFGTFYWFTKKYVPKNGYWLILFFFLFNPNLMLTELSMLRQSLAMSVCAWSIPSILSKRYVKSILFILLAATFHSSAYFLLSLPLFMVLTKFNKKIKLIIIISTFVIFVTATSLVGGILEFFIQFQQFERYDVYFNHEYEGGTGLGIALQLIVGCWMLYICPKHDITNDFFCLVFCFGIVIIPFITVIPMIGRLQFYFISLALPAYYSLIRRINIYSLSLLAIIMLISLSSYFNFFYNEIWHDAFYTYHWVFD